MEVVLQRLEQREDDVANDVAQEIGDGEQAETERTDSPAGDGLRPSRPWVHVRE